MVSTDMQPAFSAQRPMNGAQKGTPALQFPSLEYPATQVDAAKLTAPGTGFRMFISWFIAVAMLGLIIPAWFASLFMKKKIHALIKGSGVQVTQDQLPELHKTVEGFAKRLGLKKTPEVYVVEDSVQNGAAVKLGSTDIILLTDDVISAALHCGDPRAVGYVLGHELAHVALGHNKMFRMIRRRIFPSLGRLDEFTADNVATALVGDKQIAVKGITLLTVGPELLPYVNPQAMERQAREVWGNKQSKKAEQGMTHPLLFRRIANVLGAQW